MSEVDLNIWGEAIALAVIAASVVCAVLLVNKSVLIGGVPRMTGGLVIAGLGWTGGAYAGERAAELVNSFSVMCLIDQLNFAHSDQKAAAMKLTVREDMHSPLDPSGYFAHAKSWILPLSSGPHEFTVAEAHGPVGDVKTCGIAAPDVDAADFTAELVKSVKLGKPVSQKTSRDGQYRDTVWAAGGFFFVLSDGSPRNLKQGVRLLVSDKPPPG